MRRVFLGLVLGLTFGMMVSIAAQFGRRDQVVTQVTVSNIRRELEVRGDGNVCLHMSDAASFSQSVAVCGAESSPLIQWFLAPEGFPRRDHVLVLTRR